MSNPAAPCSERNSFSPLRVLSILVPAAALVIGFSVYKRHAIESEVQQEGERLLLGTLGLSNPAKNRLNAKFVDANGDLVADVPADASQQIDPDPLVFSYVGGSDSERQQAVWKEFLDALAAATGKKVEYLVLTSADEELLALQEGRLHVAGVNTGNVPAAVNTCGFVPVCTFGDNEKRTGYQVQIIVPAKSKIKDVYDLRGKEVALTERGSNSGFKAPLVLLMSDFDLRPQRDFDWVFTYGHDNSIQGIAAGKYEAAPVASDMLARAVARGDINAEDYRVIFASERFPKAAIGYVYNLKPELAAKVTEVLTNFAWAGSGLEKEFGPSGGTSFVPVNYKDDWSLIRRIDDAMGMK